MRRPRTRHLLAALLLAWLLAPEWLQIPVQGASPRDWNAQSFWFEPWGRSGTHKGIDIFARQGTPVIAPTYGLVLFRGELAVGGKVILMLGPKWRLHYFAHLNDYSALPGQPVLPGSLLGSVGDSGNARGKPAHLHYSIVTLLPYPWRWDDSTRGWKKMFYLDPNQRLRGTAVDSP
ncbi:M23 family metallopeptidase [Pseudomonas sp. BMS12]|uniref:M23 family metallopeptidase n=1 Tax=Pseudomonas sp. BMS12 TaxID=1796033 RepID=UPI00083B9742|nr:M23 family metallopeptidase [Pseudomonas sp. BMS12]